MYMGKYKGAMQLHASSQCIYGIRVYSHSFLSSKPQQVVEAIWAWGDPPCDDDTFSFDHLEVHTDGSAVLQNGWPAVPISAGWGAVFFAVRDDGSRRLLGALWGPVDVSDTSQYFLGACRPTIPVAELTAITVVFRLLRHVRFSGTLSWGTDSLYALGIMMLGHGAATACKFVNLARREVRAARASCNIKGYHTPPPYWVSTK